MLCGWMSSAVERVAAKEAIVKKTPRVIPGIEMLLAESGLPMLKGKRIGLITHAAAVDADLQASAERLRLHPQVRLVALYAPEHGMRGNAQAGEYVPYYIDERSGLPVFSLYGQTMKPVAGMFRRIDEYMRSFDTVATGKRPQREMVQDVDALVCDLQDVGTRVYTYVATMAYAMQACAENDIDFIVLDRPNPINGWEMEGPVLDYPAFSSFVGLYPIPLRHGLTIGELARLINDRFVSKKARLTVVTMKNWPRRLWFDQTGLPWVMPSPNMPSLETATVYPGQVLFEGTNLSEGRGTTRPFEIVGAPWINGSHLAEKLNDLGLAGVRFRETWFTPTFSKFQGEQCGGVQLHVIDRDRFLPVATALHMLRLLLDLYPGQTKFHEEYFDRITGTDRVRRQLLAGTVVTEIVSGWQAELARFRDMIKPYLLYE